MVQNIEMLMQYDMQLYKKSFEQNQSRIATFLCKYLNENLHNKIYALTLEENILYAWSYYFANMADENMADAEKVMNSMVVHFNYMIENQQKSSHSEEDAGKPLLLDKTFSGVWFKTAVCGMIMLNYGEDAVEKANNVLEEMYYSKSEGAKTLVLNNIKKADK